MVRVKQRRRTEGRKEGKGKRKKEANPRAMAMNNSPARSIVMMKGEGKITPHYTISSHSPMIWPAACTDGSGTLSPSLASVPRRTTRSSLPLPSPSCALLSFSLSSFSAASRNE